MRTARLAVLAAALMSGPALAHGQTVAGPTVWANDHARLVIQSVDAEGRLSGTYENFGGGFSCAGLVYPVTGWIDGDRITYSVRRKDPRNCTSVQSWTGLVRGGMLVVDYVAVGWNGSEWVGLRGADRYDRQ